MLKKSDTNKKTFNRWIIVIGAILIQVALGAIYAWSAFTTPLQGTIEIPSEFSFLKTQTQAIFSAGLATFAIFTIIGGRLQKKYGVSLWGKKVVTGLLCPTCKYKTGKRRQRPTRYIFHLA